MEWELFEKIAKELALESHTSSVLFELHSQLGCDMLGIRRATPAAAREELPAARERPRD